jgi:hypothetical protein
MGHQSWDLYNETRELRLFEWPLTISRPWYEVEQDDFHEEYAVAVLAEGKGAVVGHARCRACRGFVWAGSTAGTLAMFDAAEQLRQVAADNRNPEAVSSLTRLNERTQDWSRFGGRPQDFEDAGIEQPIDWLKYRWLKPYIDPDGEPWERVVQRLR